MDLVIPTTVGSYTDTAHQRAEVFDWHSTPSLPLTSSASIKRLPAKGKARWNSVRNKQLEKGRRE